MNAKQLIEKNNELQKELNEVNKKYYEDFLIYTRLKAFGKKEMYIEETLLEILQDILVAQKNNKTAEEYFGKNPKEVAEQILAELPKQTILENLKDYSKWILLTFVLGCLWTGFQNRNTEFALGYMVFFDIFGLIFIAFFFPLASRFIYSTKKNGLVIFSFVTAIIILAVLVGLRFATDYWRIGIVSVDPEIVKFVKVGFFLVAILYILYTARKEAKYFYFFLPPLCYFLVLSMIENSLEKDVFAIADSIAIILCSISSFLVVKFMDKSSS